jgi:hypothetical protein
MIAVTAVALAAALLFALSAFLQRRARATPLEATRRP